MQLTLKNKLDFLWHDLVSFIDQGIQDGKYAKEFKENFKELKAKDVISETNKGLPMPALRADSDPIIGKVILTLSDVAVLLDAGKDDFIEGDYQGYVLMLEKYSNDQDMNVFNQVNAAMFELTGNHYMPYLSEKGKREFNENPEELKGLLPAGLKCAPYFYDFVNKQLDWQLESNFKGEIPTKTEVIKKVIISENDKLKDIALLMLNIENLKMIGFKRFLK
jgi:hypothetical protein